MSISYTGSQSVNCENNYICAALIPDVCVIVSLATKCILQPLD